ncbi:uncharacterized protein LOC121643308 isoform X2 [Melanotaenia boesemani]|uniref:uncharacterized protein LOC121643308 isoform X2 n=1 Tax=Melanotaenia boesemani TaxID=1250792 RepID=UPI001C059AF3|nr:uncharacterized protein LOC121643308 isoform X2 [Melanotaenia boesemani]
MYHNDRRTSFFHSSKYIGMKFGYMFETAAMGTFQTASLQGQFNTSKFKVDKDHSLTIRNVSKEDEAMYFCQAGAAYQMSFVNGTHLAVNDPQNKQKTVEQSSDVELVSLGNKINLQCSFLLENKESPRQCPDEDRVFWYRAGSESDPGFIYADKSSCDKQSGRRCVSRLSKIIQNPSDVGNYYCAVATCGEILFGEGTKVEIRQEYLFVTVLGVLLACSVLVNVILIITRIIQKPACELCKDKRTASGYAEQNGPSSDQPSNMGGEEAGINYVALDFPSRKAKRLKKNNRELSGNCTYSDMRDYQ